jgi:integration host factor subunit alpha
MATGLPGNCPLLFPKDSDIVPATSKNQPGAIMTLTKENLVQSLYDQCGFSKHQSRALVETVFEMVKKSLVSGDDVLISGFGKFYVKNKSQRKGRNPATGEDLTLDARRVVTFKSSRVLRDKINSEG